MPETSPGNGAARRPYLDLLRVVSLFAVVVIHVSAPQWSRLPVDSGAWTAHTLYTCLARFSVPVFFMISGALFLDPARALPFSDILKRKLPRLIAAYLFWSAVCICASDFFKTPRGLAETLLGFGLQMVGGAYHLWFLVALGALYLLLPLLRRLAADRRLLRYFILLWLIFGVCLESAKGLGLIGETLGALLGNAHMFLVLGYSGYFMLGHYLASVSLSGTRRALLYAGALLGAAAAVALTVCGSRAAGAADSFWLGYLTPAAVLMASGLFLACRSRMERRPPSPRLCRVLARLSQCSFGAYLCHVLFIYLYEA
ncbi:MAG: acyltransferase, partial [Clostridia bacterium]|nr:acyltransferase [Clostridia bacterium]